MRNISSRIISLLNDPCTVWHSARKTAGTYKYLRNQRKNALTQSFWVWASSSKWTELSLFAILGSTKYRYIHRPLLFAETLLCFNWNVFIKLKEKDNALAYLLLKLTIISQDWRFIPQMPRDWLQRSEYLDRETMLSAIMIYKISCQDTVYNINFTSLAFKMLLVPNSTLHWGYQSPMYFDGRKGPHGYRHIS